MAKIHTPSPRTASLLCCVLLATPVVLSAQELLGVDFQGRAHAVRVADGTRRIVGPTGLAGCQGMARHDGDLWVVSRTNGPTSLARLDPHTASATVVVPDLGVDVRGLAGNPGTESLFAIVDGGGVALPLPDRLVVVDLRTGASSAVGSTGRRRLQGLAHDGTTLFGWDLDDGLVTIDPATGVATDVNPAVGTSGVVLQFLAVDTQGTLLGGNTQLFAIDRVGGRPFAIGGPGVGDLRGAEARPSQAVPFGRGCRAASIGIASLAVTGALFAGQTMNWFSSNHTPGTFGMLVVGLSTTQAGSTPLPFDVDPLLGTSGCELLVAPDLTVGAVADGFGVFDTGFLLPPLPGVTLHFQLAAFDQVPGGLSFTDGATVRLPL